ncbi:MAG: DUF3253 domain-containing protein [Janthinobacterium lividum]
MSTKEIQKVILEMATDRGAEKTICPSEVARKMFGASWREHMQTVRDIAFDLASDNQVVIMQKGQKVDPKEIKGPIRIRIKTSK